MSHPVPIRQVLSQILRQYAENPATVVPRIRHILEEAEWARHLHYCHIQYFKDTVVIRTQSPAVRHDLQYHTHHIRTLLQEMMPGIPIRRVVVR